MTNVKAEVPHGLILHPLFILIFINDLSDNLVSNPKLFGCPGYYSISTEFK